MLGNPFGFSCLLGLFLGGEACRKWHPIPTSTGAATSPQADQQQLRLHHQLAADCVSDGHPIPIQHQSPIIASMCELLWLTPGFSQLFPILQKVLSCMSVLSWSSTTAPSSPSHILRFSARGNYAMGWEAVHADQALVSATKVWGPRMSEVTRMPQDGPDPRSQPGMSGCFENGIVSLIPLVYHLGNSGLQILPFLARPIKESQAIKMNMLAMLAKNMFSFCIYQLYVRLGDPQKHWLGTLPSGLLISPTSAT